MLLLYQLHDLRQHFLLLGQKCQTIKFAPQMQVADM